MRIILSVFMSILLGVLVICQIQKVSAQSYTLKPIPVTSPITSPVTSPLTDPLTAPTRVLPPPSVYYYLKGNVFYRIFNFKIPAIGAIIKAVENKTGKEYSVKTNMFGSYAFLLEPGIYKVYAQDAKNTSFTPVDRIVNLSHDANNISFEGKYKNPQVTHTLSGRVNYFDYRRGTTKAYGVYIEAVNVSTNQKYLVQTDRNGVYKLTIKTGTYKLKAYDNLKTIFTPQTLTINITRDVSNIYFTGYLNTTKMRAR